MTHPRSAHRASHAAATALSALAFAVLAACGGGDDARPPAITAQPQALALPEGGSGSFAVSATGEGALSYQWLNAVNDAPILGATAATLAVDAVSMARDGGSVKVSIANNAGSVTSASAALTVSERAWSAPSTALSAGPRQIASVVDSNGHTHLLAITGNNLAAAVEARIQLRPAQTNQANAFTLPGNATLQASEALASGVGTSIAAAANGSGHVLAVWHRNGIVGGALYTPASDAAAAGAWTLLPTRINDFSANSARDPVVVALGNDAFEIAWRERIAPALVHDVKVRRYMIGGNTFAAPVTVEASAVETEAPRMVSDAAGNVLLAFRHTGVGTVINRRLAAAAWGTATTTVDASSMLLDALHSNAAGKAVLVTSNRVGSASALRLDLAAADPVAPGGAAPTNAYGSPADALVDAAGRVHVFGVSMDSGNNNHTRLFRWSASAAGVWSAAEPVSAINTSDFLATLQGVVNPKVAGVDAEGNFIVAWQDRVSTGDNPVSGHSARRFHAGLDAWRATVAVASGGNAVPSIAMGRDGRASLVFGGSDATVRAASLR